jgi:hypothetical protein
MCDTPERELNPPDLGDDDTNYYDALISLFDNALKLSDYDEESHLLADQVNIILNDTEDDKLGRIRTLYDVRKAELATAVLKYHETSGYHAGIMQEALENYG